MRRADLGGVGLIGSAIKKVRFVKRMREAGLADNALARLTCPIGVPGIGGKEPAVIAAAVAAQLLQWRDTVAASGREPASLRTARAGVIGACGGNWTTRMSIDSGDRAFLKRAVDISFEHMRSGEGKPFGAVLVLDGKPVAEGWNSIFSSKDPDGPCRDDGRAAAPARCWAAPISRARCSTLLASPARCASARCTSPRVSRCFYATTKEEATRIGNMTEAIYAEYPKPPAAAGLPCVHVPMPEASVALRRVALAGALNARCSDDAP